MEAREKVNGKANVPSIEETTRSSLKLSREEHGLLLQLHARRAELEARHKAEQSRFMAEQERHSIALAAHAADVGRVFSMIEQSHNLEPGSINNTHALNLESGTLVENSDAK
jgi:hypothetical protein